MKRITAIGSTAAGVLLLAAITSSSFTSKSNTVDNPVSVKGAQSSQSELKAAPKVKPICDGTTITTDCAVGEVNYSTYIYHPAVPEKSHSVTTTTYQKKIVGYCTLCNDGTYSPSCATGSGACSWHQGVAEWNAPEYSTVPVSNTSIVIDAPAQDAYYEKVLQ